MEGQTSEETEVIFIGFASSDIAIERDNSTVLYNVMWEIFPSAEGMIANLCDKPGDIRNEIDNSFTVWFLLAYPLQEIDVVYLSIQAL